MNRFSYYLRQIIKTFKTIFRNKNNYIKLIIYNLFLILLILGFEILFYGINFYILYSKLELILTLIFVIEISILLLFQEYNIKNQISNLKNKKTSYINLIIIILISCPSCLIGSLGIIGFTNLGFLSFLDIFVKHRSIFLIIFIILELIPIYLLSKKINGICKKCNLNKIKSKLNQN